MTFPQFFGPPCGSYGSYTFHKGFKYFKHGKFRCVNLGEFFFVRISSNHDPCIGELELLWNDQSSDQRLSSLRLYFLPEQTPEGRQSSHGEDEVLVASDKIVLRLDDLVEWITDQVEWNHGLLAVCCEADLPTTACNGHGQPKLDRSNSEDAKEPEVSVVEDSPSAKDADEKTSTDQQRSADQQCGFESTDEVKCNSPPAEDASSSTETASITTRQEQDLPDSTEPFDQEELRVLILPYASYCRYKTILKRLEGFADKWMAHSLVLALGGMVNSGRNTHVLFCRDTFDHEELAHHELNCEYLAPTLKVKRRKKKSKTARSTSPGSESNTSDENKETPVKSISNGFKQPPCKNEQEFLQRLYKFMKKRKTPIIRVPHLGFKQIDLYVFYSFAQKLGGYDKITTKRLWKHVYDVLGGDPGSTSAATCTRRHYERLLLPFERFMEGIDYKPKQNRKQARPQKKAKDENENVMSCEKDAGQMMMVKEEPDDTYVFTDSNHENSKDSLINDEPPSGDEQPLNFSDEDSKSIWSIQKNVDSEELEKNGNKQVKPLIIQKEQNESFSEKERKWNEIRRKNALARKWVRQLRPSRGGKIPGSEKMTDKESCSSEPDLLDNIKKEVPAVATNFLKDSQTTSSGHSLKRELYDSSSMDPSHLSEKYKCMPIQYDSKRMDSNRKSGYFAKAPPDTPFVTSRTTHPAQSKSEPYVRDSKSWCGYTQDGLYQVTPAPERYPYGFEMNMIHGFAKTGHQSSENGPMKPLSSSSSESSAHNSVDCKANISQRRPSVIQHTEYVTSPSQSPKLMSSEGSYPEAHMDFSSNAKLISAVSNHLAHTMTGKVSEWLSKGVPEAVACKTPCVPTEKTTEMHDKVLMPSSCKTPGPGTGKVPSYSGKNKMMEPYGYMGTSKPVRDRCSTSHRAGEGVKRPPSYGTSHTSNLAYQKAFHPITAPINSLNPYMRPGMKHDHTFLNTAKVTKAHETLSSSQPKGHKLVLPSPIPHRPSLLPFSRQQTYRTSPLSDIPKLRSGPSNDNVVLDLSVKKKAPGEKVPPPIKSVPLVSELPADEAVCLDLSVKKKPLTRENIIENITPPLSTMSPHQSSYTSKPLKPLPTLIALQDLIREESNRQKSSSIKPAAIGAPSGMPSNSFMYADSAQQKIPHNFIPSPETKSVYLTGPDATFPPYVISPFYAAGWAATANKTANASSNNNTSCTTSPNSFKDGVGHSVFPKQYAYNLKQQFQSLLCKDNGCYPPSCK